MPAAYLNGFSVNAKMLRPLAAEFVGTALFVFLGAGSVVMNANTPGPAGLLAVALVHGVGLAVIVSAIMGISGGHINPAVTFAIYLARKVDGKTAGGYVGAQLAGGVAGAALVKALLPPASVRLTSAGVPMLAGPVGGLAGASLEAICTFLLASAVFGTAVSSEAPKIGGFGIGLAVMVSVLVAGPLTGAALNPARAFGPAVVAWEWHAQAVYWIGPLAGAALAALLWKLLLLPREATEIR